MGEAARNARSTPKIVRYFWGRSQKWYLTDTSIYLGLGGWDQIFVFMPVASGVQDIGTGVKTKDLPPPTKGRPNLIGSTKRW